MCINTERCIHTRIWCSINQQLNLKDISFSSTRGFRLVHNQRAHQPTAMWLRKTWSFQCERCWIMSWNGWCGSQRADKPPCCWVRDWFCTARDSRSLQIHDIKMYILIFILPFVMMARNRNWCNYWKFMCVTTWTVLVDCTCFVLDWTSKTGPCHELCRCIMEQLASEPLACLRGPSKSPWHPDSHPAWLALKEVQMFAKLVSCGSWSWLGKI